MSAPEGDNPHTELLAFGTVVYWQDGRACGKRDPWTNAKVQAFGQFPYIEFTRDQESKMLDVLRLMENAYVRGRADKASEIRRVLGVPGNPVQGWTP